MAENKDLGPPGSAVSADAATPKSATPFGATSSRQLTNAAEAMELWEDVKGWRNNADVTDRNTKVQWAFGRSVAGYSELSFEVSRIVGERLGCVIQEALDRIELRARKAYEEALGIGDGAPSASTTDAGQ